MADFASNRRPAHSPIFAFAPTETSARRLTLNRDLVAFHLPFEAPSERAIPAAEEILLERGLVRPGDKLVIISDSQGGDQHFDSVQVRTVV
jgi:pyruvate kinase